MGLQPRKLVALAYVADVDRSIAFYESLGFNVINSFAPEEDPGRLWAWLRCDSTDLMVSRASEPIRARDQAVLFYLYFDDIAATREALLAKGFAIGPLRRRVYCTEGECRLEDPDGHVLMLTQT
jgi:catechol 2,3-dioxygenase-like lactoylglutathione lyase family enzyme